MHLNTDVRCLVKTLKIELNFGACTPLYRERNEMYWCRLRASEVVRFRQDAHMTVVMDGSWTYINLFIYSFVPDQQSLCPRFRVPFK